MNINDNFDINEPPEGAWIRQESDTLVLGATTRSLEAFFSFPLAIIMLGLASALLIGTQIYTGEFYLSLTLFSIPFYIISYYLIVRPAFMSVGGKIEMILDDKNLKIFSGIGRLGGTQIFPLETVRVDIKEKNNHRYLVLLSGKDDIFQYYQLDEAQRHYLLKAMQKVMDDKNDGKNFLKQDLSEHLMP